MFKRKRTASTNGDMLEVRQKRAQAEEALALARHELARDDRKIIQPLKATRRELEQENHISARIYRSLQKGMES